MLFALLNTTAPYLALGAFVLALVAIVLQISIHRRISKLTLGSTGSLEDTLAILSEESKTAKEFRADLEKYLKLVESRLRRNVSGISMIRFNPFSGDGSGGNQSFAVAFLDERHNGVVLSSLYARDRVAIYGKPVTQGTSTFELTKEEKEAIERAKKLIVEQETIK